MIGATTAYFKIKEMTSFHCILQGGMSASKTWSIAQILLELAMEKKRVITVATDTFLNLRDGIIQDYKNMFAMTNMDFDQYYNQQDKELKIGKSVIQFRYVVGHKDQAGKSKRRDILYVNETTKIPWSAISGYISRTSERCYYDLNPDFETWTHTEIEPLPNAQRLILTYLDNEFCPEAEKTFIESRRHDKAWFTVYGEGQTGTYSERRIYPFTIVDDIPSDAARINSGLDFGVSPDPTFLVDLYLKGSDLYIKQLFCDNGLLPEKIVGAERMAIVDKMEEIQFSKGWRVGADSSGAVEIKDLKKHRYNVHAVPKPPGSVIDGIKKLKMYSIHLVAGGDQLKKGFESWFWKVDANGKIIPEPDGHEPDGCAASRYGIMDYKATPKRSGGRSDY